MATQLPAVVGQPTRPQTLPPQSSAAAAASPTSPLAPSLPSAASARRHRGGLEDVDHPFNEPHSILKALKMEINDLRSALQMEQRQRGFELERVGQDLVGLQKQLAEDKTDLQVANRDWNKSLVGEVTRLSAVVRELDTRLSSKSNMLHDAALTEVTSVRQELVKLAASTAEKDEHLQQAVDALTALIKANSEGDNEFSRQVIETQDANKVRLKRIEEDMLVSNQTFLDLSKQTARLHGAIDEMATNHLQEYQGMHALLLAEVSSMEKVIAEFRESTASAIRRHWKTMSDDFAEVRAKITGLNTGLESERHERYQTADVLQSRIEDNWSQTMKWTPVSKDRPSALYTHRPRQ